MSERTLNIILVEDDDVDVMNVRRAFEKAGIVANLHVARDGVDGLALLRSGKVPPDRQLILLDINMPRMSGLEMLQELRGDPALAAIPVVVLTTSNDERDRTDAYRHHVAGYLLKPVTFPAFVDLITLLVKYWTAVEMA
jgi:CheY-like chemotaxis protein